MSFKKQALAYAEQGFSVFPLHPMDKKPITKNGCKDATRDFKQIERWWIENPNYNIGIACGKVSLLLVIDLDVDEEKGINGYESLRVWERENGKLPDTWQTKTGKGGCHLFYRTDKTYNNNVNLYPGIDIRTTGGYIVAPPSIHPNGRRYEWEIGMGDGVEMAAVDETVEKFLTKPKGKDEHIFHTPNIISEGERNRTLFELACSMRARGDAESAIKAALYATNKERCVPVLEDKEVDSIFNSVIKYKSGTAPYKVVCDNGTARPIKERKKINYRTAKELLESNLPPVEYVVDVIVAKGLVVLSAKSKMGKSWFALQLAVAVANGSRFLGFNTKQGGVLYIDLENAESIAQSRLITVLNGTEPPESLTLVNDYTTLNDTFLEDLSEYLEANRNTSLVIVDVFQKIKTPKKKGQSDYDDIYENFTPLKKITEKYGICLMLVMHNRKMNDPSDPFSNILGSTAIMGASDEVLVIHKKSRNDEESTLSITGRTVQEGEYGVKFNKQFCKWEMLGDSEELQKKKFRNEYENCQIVRAIKKLVDLNGGAYVGTITEIIKASEKLKGCRIYDNPTKCGITLKKFIPLLEQYDAIEYFPHSNGNASSKHEFKKIFP